MGTFRIKETIKTIIEKEINAIKKLPITDSYELAVKFIVEQVHEKGGKIVISGMGKAGQIGCSIATKFSSTGSPAVFLHPSEAQHGDLGLIQKNDIMILLSNSGRTREVVDLVGLARQLHPTLKFITITGRQDSELAVLSNVCLCIGDNLEVGPLALTPTTSTTLMSIVGDILVVNTMKIIGFTKKEYAKRHNGGFLGEQSKK